MQNLKFIVVNSTVDVQSQWNALEHSLITAADIVAPLVECKQSQKSKRKDVPPDVRRILQRRRHILKIEKSRNDGCHSTEIRAMNKKIRNFHAENRKTRVRGFADGSNGSIWRAVGAAKDLNPNAIPANLTVGGVRVEPGWAAGAFAEHFSEKIALNVSRARVDVNGVYNGKLKLIVQNRNFMTKNDVKLCLHELSNKKCEGFDRIPLCMLYDACDTLLLPMANLFGEIYRTCKIPEQ